MIKIRIVTPIKCYVDNATPEEVVNLQKSLTYTDTSVSFALQNLKKNKWLQKEKPYTYQKRKEELESQLKTCMLKFDTETGKPWFHPGSLGYLTGYQFDISTDIVYPEPSKVAWRKVLPFNLYHYQDSSARLLIEAKHACVELCTGCHVKGQEILMYDGSIKKVENIAVDELLMGPDSKPRKVLKLHRGEEKMAKIIPVKGESFVVNMGHILSLTKTNNKSEYITKNIKRRKDWKGTSSIVNISVKDYLKETISFKHRHKLYRTGVDFESKELTIDPYILGLWLGDGSSAGPALTVGDSDSVIVDLWRGYADSLNLNIRTERKTDANCQTIHMTKKEKPYKNTMRNYLYKMNLIKNKHIPEDYKTSSKEDRVQILAGLMDSDGHLSKNTFEITQKNKQLSDDILFIARSLGLAAYQKECKKKSQNGTEGTYYRIIISGDIDIIPTMLERKKAKPRKQTKDVLRTGFEVEELPEDSYYGFEVDQDNLYVMADFTVTHNSGKTAIILTIARELGLRTVIVTPSKSIFNEILEKFEHHFGKSNVGAYGGGKKRIGKKFTVCVSKSLTLLKPGTAEYDFFANAEVIIGDESHTLAANTLESVFHGVLKKAPYRFFLSGTQVRGDGKDKLLESIIGNKVYQLTTREAIAGGFICPVKFIVFETTSKDPSRVGDPLKAKRKHFLYNDNIADIAAKIANSAWNHAQESTLILVEELEQIKMLKDRLNVPFDYVHSGSKADAAKFGLETRKVSEVVEAFNLGQIKVLVGTSCISTGTNMYPCHNTVNMVGGGSEVKTKQGTVGRSVRLLEKSEYKQYHKPKPFSKIYDFNVTNNTLMEKHLQKRISMYEESLEEEDEIRFINA
jgi:superfamily II DNA or RNA helicase